MKLKNYKEWITYGTLVLLGVLFSKTVIAQPTHPAIQTPEFVADINTAGLESDPRYLKEIDGKVYFTALDREEDYELFIYDGSTIEEIDFRNLSNSYGAPINFTKYDDDIYFYTNIGDTDEGFELHKFDGTSVTLVADINLGGNSYVSNQIMLVFDNKIFFTANNGTSGEELFSYDGTEVTLHDINDGAGASNPRSFFVYGDELLFTADDGTNGRELWHYDGAGVSMVANNNDTEDFHASDFTVYGDYVYFSAQEDLAESGTRYKLYRYNGTTVENVSTALSQTVGLNPRGLGIIDDELVFMGYESPFSKIWSFDGTTMSAVQTVSGSVYGHMAILGDDFIYVADYENGRELWVYDGTDLTEYDIFSGELDSYPSNLVVAEDRVYFQAQAANEGYELWYYDGTGVNQVVIMEGSQGSQPSYVTIVGDEVLMQANMSSGDELIRLSGATVTQLQVRDNTETTEFGDDFVELNGNLYFGADDGIHGFELWTYDGETLSLVADLYDGSSGADFEDIVRFNDKLYMSAEVLWQEVDYGAELVEFDGENIKIIDVNDGSSSSTPRHLTVFDGNLYFNADDGITGRELWKYDGSNLSQAADIYAGEGNSSEPEDLIVYKGILYMQAEDEVDGKELWSYNGTSATRVSDLNPGSGDAYLSNMTVAGDKLFFRLQMNESVDVLYSYDGTSLNEIELVDEGGNSNPSNLVEYNGTLVFTGSDGINGEELWQYDGTDVTMFEVNVGAGSADIVEFFEFQDELYFGADDGTTGSDLWKFDGTEVSLVWNVDGDTDDGIYDENDQLFGVLGPFMYFAGFSENYGEELYRINNEESPRSFGSIVQDLVAGEDSFSPHNFFNFGDHLYFLGEDHRGEELWRVRAIGEDNDLLSFSISGQEGESTIDTDDHTVALVMPFDTDLTSLTPSFETSAYATSSLSSGAAQDFTNEITYTITSEYLIDQDWTVKVTLGAEPEEPDPSSTVTGLNDGLSDVKIYPNPANDWITLQGKLTSLATFKLFDLGGSELISKRVPEDGRVDLKSIETGLYFIRIEDKDITTTTKILIH